ncbi:hypothetical protein A8C32_07300 [Flavivirga aquatica]|uniref:Glycosyltransferase 2-like domain-containing protein n=1 Tax=Flavivirga aquatica TaxID=1849968 RepID=A0A1E5SIP2_9FLAO|nr:glycosyltransferase family 2 protein [Flavivirga aquatica]OEJ98980.1 hypothetical protein A8C32_07300 [Flavivirga aquatica]
MPFFSVIIPLYNKESHIKDTLNSIIKQNFKDFEIIIINDGSTDGSLEAAKLVSDNRIKIYSQNNSGASSARNLGIKKAIGNYIALMDGDDIWYPNHLQEFHNSISKFPDAGLFCNAYDIKLSKSQIVKASYSIRKREIPHIIDDYFLASTIRSLGWTSAIAFSKNDFYNIGEFKPKITSGQDLDFLIRFALKKTVIFNPKTTCYYDKTVANSLSKENHQESKRILFNSFQQEEKLNKSLNIYLNLNRYSLAIQCKLAKNKTTFAKLYPEIDKKLLNFKQKILLEMPSNILMLTKKFHLFLITKGIYISSFK